MKANPFPAILLLVCPLALGACGGGNPAEDITATLPYIQANIFTPSCGKSECHEGDSPPMGLRLTEGDSYGMLLGTDGSGIPSIEKPATLRVKPGDPDNSYLIQKLEGASNIDGVQMPKNGPYLSDTQIQSIRNWILAGAPES